MGTVLWAFTNMGTRGTALRETALNVLTDVLMRLAFMSHGGWMAPILKSYRFPWYTEPSKRYPQLAEDESILRTPKWLRRRKVDTYLK